MDFFKKRPQAVDKFDRFTEQYKDKEEGTPEVTKNTLADIGDITNATCMIGSNIYIQRSYELSIQEKELLRIYRSANGKTQMEIMQFIYNKDIR